MTIKTPRMWTYFIKIISLLTTVGFLIQQRVMTIGWNSDNPLLICSKFKIPGQQSTVEAIEIDINWWERTVTDVRLIPRSRKPNEIQGVISDEPTHDSQTSLNDPAISVVQCLDIEQQVVDHKVNYLGYLRLVPSISLKNQRNNRQEGEGDNDRVMARKKTGAKQSKCLAVKPSPTKPPNNRETPEEWFGRLG